MVGVMGYWVKIGVLERGLRGGGNVGGVSGKRWESWDWVMGVGVMWVGKVMLGLGWIVMMVGLMGMVGYGVRVGKDGLRLLGKMVR